MKNKRNIFGFTPSRSGFTVLEILIAVSIIAILSIIGIASFTSINKRSRDAKRKSDVEQVRSALEMYRVDNGVYPAGIGETFQQLSDLDTGSGSGPLVSAYLPGIPTDPKSTAATSVQYYYKPIKGTNPNYYSYCICALLEGDSGSNACRNTDGSTLSLPAACNYGLKNP